MSNITHGMNVEEVRRLGADLRSLGDRLDEMAKRLDGCVSGATWTGPDSKKFKQDWWPKHRSNLQGIANDLRGFGDSAKNNADEQERVSGGTVGGAWGSSPGYVSPVEPNPWKLGWRLAQNAPVLGTGIGIGKIAWQGTMFSKANWDEAIARIRYGGDSEITRAAERETQNRSWAILRETVDTGVGLTPIGMYRDGADSVDAIGDYFFGTGDHSDVLSPGGQGTRYMQKFVE